MDEADAKIVKKAFETLEFETLELKIRGFETRGYETAIILPNAVKALAINKTYAVNNIIHHQDEIFQHIGFIQSGRAFALTVDIDGNETWVSEFTAGQFMGCHSLFDPRPSPYQIIAKTTLRCLLFNTQNFLSLMNEYEALNNMVVADLARQVDNLTRAQINTYRLSMRGQIISELARIARPVGKDPNTFIIRPRPIFSELAQRLGTSRETVSRTVSSLVKKDVLVRTTGALIIPNYKALTHQIV